ncbi:Urea carboxylase-related ABC transporter, periplasmic substrate-binding protein [Synechocystis sp. PCC 6714]|nr:Urea carboxylase-related ABC transporter, periplasmic substrate-binding protein [Synechocystis sp. PCC 6714]
MNDWPGYNIIIYAEAKGLFTEKGLDVEIVHFEEQNDNFRATMRGYQDASFISLPQVMQIDFPQTSPEFVLVSDVSAGSDGIVARPDLNFIAEMTGKKISARFGSLSHVILLEALWANGIKSNEVEIVDLANEEGLEQLKEGTIDAAVLWEPALHQIAKEIGGNVIYTTAELDSIIVDGLVVPSEIAETKREELIRFIQVWFQVMEAVETNPQEVFTVVAEKLDIPVEVFARGFEGMIHGDRILNEEMLVQGRLKSVVGRIRQLLLESCRHGLILRENVLVNSQLFSRAVQRS